MILQAANTPIPVRVTKSRMMNIPNEINTIGLLQAQSQINVTSQMAGQITAITYIPGSFVTKGTLLIQLDPRIEQAKVMSDQAALDAAQVDFGRYSKLAAMGLQPQEKLDQERQAYQQDKASLFADQTSLSQTQITAPFDGYVGAKTMSVGDAIQTGQTLTTLTDRAHLLVDYQVPERFLTALKLGQIIELDVPGQSSLNEKGIVSYIAPTVSTDTHTLEVQAAIPNPQNKLAPGLFVQVHEQIGVNQNAVVVPQASVVPTITGNKVYVMKQNKAVATNVTTGVTIKDLVVIEEGLAAGETVVTAGLDQLKDGSDIREVNTP